MAAMALPNVGYATNADHGMGCDIHPANKQACSRRLARAALAILYNKTTAADWRSPTYRSATQLRPYYKDAGRNGETIVVDVQLRVTLSDLSASGLFLQTQFNYESPGYGPASKAVPMIVDCTASFPVNATTNASMATQCAWASLHVATVGWVNATVSVDSGRGSGGSGEREIVHGRPTASEASAKEGSEAAKRRKRQAGDCKTASGRLSVSGRAHVRPHIWPSTCAAAHMAEHMCGRAHERPST